MVQPIMHSIVSLPAEKPRWCCSSIGCMWFGVKVCSMGPLSQLEYSGRFCRGSCGHPTLCSRSTAGVRQRHLQRCAKRCSGQALQGQLRPPHVWQTFNTLGTHILDPAYSTAALKQAIQMLHSVATLPRWGF